MDRNIAISLQNTFRDIGNDIIGFIPELVVAILIVIAGWLIGIFFKGITEKLFASLKLNEALDRAGVDTLTQRAGYKFKPGAFVGSLIKWFFIIVFTVVALDVLQLNQVTAFFSEEVLTYLPRVIVAALILLGSMLLAQFVGASVEGAARAGGFASAELVGNFTRYAIIVFAVLAALNQLQIAPELVQLLFAGIVFGLSLAFGLAFGLGGRETAGRYLTTLANKGTNSGGGGHTGGPR